MGEAPTGVGMGDPQGSLVLLASVDVSGRAQTAKVTVFFPWSGLVLGNRTKEASGLWGGFCVFLLEFPGPYPVSTLPHRASDGSW